MHKTKLTTKDARSNSAPDNTTKKSTHVAFLLKNRSLTYPQLELAAYFRRGKHLNPAQTMLPLPLAPRAPPAPFAVGCDDVALWKNKTLLEQDTIVEMHPLGKISGPKRYLRCAMAMSGAQAGYQLSPLPGFGASITGMNLRDDVSDELIDQIKLDVTR